MITAKRLVNRSGLNENIKALGTKEEIKKISNKCRIKSRAR